ncbi:MAG: methyltransferase domain-containing protein [Anaerolineae bacterium]|nr:methyltransferase domain-containing protein [Anaerolineae bacterium]
MTDQAIIERIVGNEADMAYRRRVQTIFDWLEPTDGDMIIDGGCGRGFYLRFIRHTCNAELTGIELDQPIIEKAREALAGFAGITLVNGSLLSLPLSDGRYNKAILSEVLEHVPDDVGALKEIARVLRPGGLIAITVPNANYPFWWDPINKTLETIFKTHISHGFFAGIWANHVRLYTESELQGVVRAAGLEIVEERRFTHHCFPFIHNIVYGFGKTVLEAGMLPKGMAAVADRHTIDETKKKGFNPVSIGLRVFEWFDRRNVMNEKPGRSTVNLCILARKVE